MAITYDTLGSTVTIHPTGFVPPSSLNTSVAIVGGYDETNADSGVNAGETTAVNSSTEAETAFGADSELAYQARLAFANGASEVIGVPVAETQETETFGSSSSTDSGTLANTPAFDPRVHPDHEITAQDLTDAATVDVTVVDADTPTQPSNSNTINISADSGSWRADSASEYSITYTHGDYTSAIETAAPLNVRYVAVCTENDGIIGTSQTELTTAASNLQLGRAVVGSDLSLSVSGSSSYTPAVEDWRVVEVASPRGTDNQDNKVRTVGAIAGLLAQQPIDVEGSITYDEVAGLKALDVEFSPTQAEAFDQVTAITDQFEVAEGVTTSAESGFRDIYATEIIDLIVETLFARVKNYKGGSNARGEQRLFASKLKRLLSSYSVPDAQPPLLATADGTKPYSVTVGVGASATETDVDIGINVAPIAKEVKLDVSTGPLQLNDVSTA